MRRTTKAARSYFHTVDLFLSIGPARGGCTRKPPSDGDIVLVPYTTDKTLETLVRACYMARKSAEGSLAVAIKLLLVSGEGFLVRNDILELRLRHSELIDLVIPLSRNCQFHSPHTNALSLLSVLSCSPGALLAMESTAHITDTMQLLEEDLENRLSFDWIIPAEPSSRTVAIVGGRPPLDIKNNSYASEGPFTAAKALGFSTLVLDRPGHWLQAETYANLRDDFIAIDMTNNECLPRSIAEGLKGRHVDGIVTFSDEYVIATAQAAEILGLPTGPVHAILQAHHKDKTRELLPSPDIQVAKVDSIADLHHPKNAHLFSSLRYPLVVKPNRGAGSTGVKRVDNEASMCKALRQLEDAGLAKDGILVETYIDGPEVDVNFVLWKGQVLFFEVADDFPCKADALKATPADNFAETIILLPSCLGQNEIEVLRKSLHSSLVQMGFHSGVFHVEARMRHSAMSYQVTNGLLDLVETTHTAGGHPEAFLIEVNARPPGLQSVFSTMYTYGVDFCALQLLNSVGDHERFRALASPFSQRHQYWCGLCQIPVHRENVLVPDNFFGKLFQKLPDVASNLSRAELLTQPGKVISPRGGSWFVGYVLLYSRSSRTHILQMYNSVLDASRELLDRT